MVHVLLKIDRFFYLGVIISKALTSLAAIFDSEQLSLVVSGDGGIGIGISWEEGQLFGHIGVLRHGVLLYDLVFRMSLRLVWMNVIR